MAYDNAVMSRTLKLRFEVAYKISTREKVMEEIKDLMNLESIEGIYKCEGRDWYVCFDSQDIVERLGDLGKVFGKGQEEMCINIERIDRFPIKFRIHWFPYHMNIEDVKTFMSHFGKKVST